MKSEIETKIYQCLDKGKYDLDKLINAYHFHIDDYDQSEQKEIRQFFRTIEKSLAFKIDQNHRFNYETFFYFCTGENIDYRCFLSDLTRWQLLNLKAAYLNLINEPSGFILNQILLFCKPKATETSANIVAVLNLDQLNLVNKLKYLDCQSVKLKSNDLKNIGNYDVIQALLDRSYEVELPFYLQKISNQQILVINFDHLDDFGFKIDDQTIRIKINYQNRLHQIILLNNQSNLTNLELNNSSCKISCDFLNINNYNWISDFENAFKIKLLNHNPLKVH